MKKTVLGILTILMCISMFACSGSSEVKEAQYKYDQDGVVISYTIKYQKDVVKEIIQDQEMQFEGLGFTKEAMEEQVEVVKADYDVPGIEYTAEIDESSLKEKITIDTEKVEMKKLVEIGILQADTKDVKFISFKMTEKMLLEQGFRKLIQV